MTYTKMFAREYTVQYADVCLRMASEDLKDHVPLVSKTFTWFPEQGNEVLCQATDDWLQVLKEVERRYSVPAEREQLVERFHRYGEKHVALAKELGTLPFSSLTNAQLKSHYENYFSTWILYTAYLWIGFLLNDILAAQGQKVLESKDLKEEIKGEVLSILLSPIKKSGVLTLQEHLSGLKKQGVAVLPPEEIEKILRDFAWMPCLDLQKDPWQASDVQAFYEQQGIIQEPTMSFEEAAQAAQLSAEEQHLFSQIRDFAYIKDMRDVYRRSAVYYFIPFFEELGRRFMMSHKDVAYMTYEEVRAGLMGGPLVSLDVIRKRKQGFLMQWKGDDIMITTDKAAIERFKEYFVEEDTKEIRGVAASKGVVSGAVKIVRGVEDLKKVEMGDILVALTTHPDYVPAMQRAAAFVTNEGGLTSHAAIVAREMKKPCVVGTKHATKMLTDGDIVEVNANQGIVKILKKHE